MERYTFMYELALNENGNIEAILEIPPSKRNGTSVSGLNFEITENDLRRMSHLFQMAKIERLEGGYE